MRRIWLLLGLSLCIHSAAAWVEPLPTSVAEETAEALAPTDPVASRLDKLQALRDNDAAGFLIATGGEEALRAFLEEDAHETPQTIADKIADTPVSDDEARMLGLWTTLAGPDGVARASAEWYPRWQQQLPQMLAGAQMGLAAMGSSIAESTTMSDLNRAQMMELQWALTGWLSRTDFADRKQFEQVLGYAREWILASGKAHPMELVLTTPEQRLQLAERAMRSFKQALKLYGLDADATLASVRVEQLARDGDRAKLRTSANVLGVPLTIEEDLRWYQGEWTEAERVEQMERFRAEREAEEAAEAAEEAAGEVEKDLTDTGCSAPTV